MKALGIDDFMVPVNLQDIIDRLNTPSPEVVERFPASITVERGQPVSLAFKLKQSADVVWKVDGKAVKSDKNFKVYI